MSNFTALETVAVTDLYDWSLNFTNRSPFRKFLDVVGWSAEQGHGPLANWSDPSDELGFQELHLLGNALKEYANYPQSVLVTIQALLDAEMEEELNWCEACQGFHGGRAHSRD